MLSKCLSQNENFLIKKFLFTINNNIIINDDIPKNLKEILLLLIFFWLATGIGGEINPATLLRKIPFIGQAHLESRYFVVFMIFYIIVLARVIDRNITSKMLLIIVLGLLTLEFIYVRNYPSFEAFKLGSYNNEFPSYITKRKITQTLENVLKPEVYLLDNTASKACYESIRIETNVRHINEPQYRGEFHLLNTTGDVEILEFSPGFINAKYELNSPGTVVFNTNSNDSWVVNEPNMIVGNSKNLLAVSVNQGKGILNLHYRPPYLKYIIAFYIFGVILYLLIARRIYYKK